MSEEEKVVFEVDPEKITSVVKDEIAKAMKDLKEMLVKPETPNAATEPMGDEDVLTDYRTQLVENLVNPRESANFQWHGPEDNDAVKHLGEVKVTDPKLQETIGAPTTTNAVPEIWAAEVERLSVYPQSAFWNAPYINWKKEIQGKPGDTVNVITVAPVTCADLACDEPTTTAATIGKVPITLVDKVCAYYLCKTDMEDVVPDTIDKLNEGLASCLDVCIDNYFLAQALIGANAGTYTHTAALTGSLIARCMGSMEAGTYEPAVLIMHPIPYKGLMMDSQFTNAATFGNRDVIASGRIANYLGIDFVERPKGTLAVGGGTYRSLLLAKSAIAGAIKRGITLETEYVARLQRKYILASVRFGGTVVHTNGVFWIVTVQS